MNKRQDNTAAVAALSQLPNPTFTTRDGETEVDCPENLLASYNELRFELRRQYVRACSSFNLPGDSGLRLRESTVCGILAWAINQAIDDPVELTPAGLTYSRCFDLAVGIAKGTPADKMPEWMPVAAILVRAHQL